MTDYETHEPECSGTTTEGWDDPQLEDFGTDDPSEVDDLREEVEDLIDELANEHFEGADFGQ